MNTNTPDETEAMYCHAKGVADAWRKERDVPCDYSEKQQSLMQTWPELAEAVADLASFYRTGHAAKEHYTAQPVRDIADDDAGRLRGADGLGEFLAGEIDNFLRQGTLGDLPAFIKASIDEWFVTRDIAEADFYSKP